MSISSSSRPGKDIQPRGFAAVRRRVPVVVAMTVVLVLGGVTGYVLAKPRDMGNDIAGPSGTSGAANLGPLSIFPDGIQTFSMQYKVIAGSQADARGSVLIRGPGVIARASGIRRTYANGCPGARSSPG